MPTAAEIKKALRSAGLEVYRTRGEVVHLADRVRENLLMDADTYIGPAASEPGQEVQSTGLRVGFVVRAQRNDFPSDGDEHLFLRARQVAAAAVERGYREVGAEVHKVLDPGNGDRTLDTWCEVSFEKETADMETAIAEARFALSLEKAAAPTRTS
jgi:hypothetical protein